MKDLHDLIAHLDSLGVALWDDDGYLGYSAPEGTLGPELLEELRQHKDGILTLLRQERDARPQQELHASPHSGKLPVSAAQRRLWFLSQLEGANVAYNMPFVSDLAGPLDVRALSLGIDELVRRHESLRTTFCLEAEGPMQVIHPPRPVAFPIDDLSDLAETARETELERRIGREVHRAFDLERGPLLRARLFRVSSTRHVLALSIHHIVGDGWSMGVFVRELAALYGAFVASRPSPLPEPVLQYADFSRWQGERLSGSVAARQLAYWREKLAGLEPLRLPADRPRPAVESFRGDHHIFHLDRELTRSLQTLSREEGVTLYVSLLAAFDVLLARLSGQHDIAVSSGTANRKHPALEALIGFFVSTLVMRCDLSENPTFRALLSQVNTAVTEAIEHEDLPFERIVEELQPERTAGHNPLAQVALTLQSFSSVDLTLPGLTASRWDKIRFSTSKFDLMLLITEVDSGLEVIFEYNSDLFDRQTIERWSAHYHNLLRAVVADRDRPIGQLSLLDQEERRKLLVAWNQTAAPFSSDICVQNLFEAQVERDPDAIAIVDLCGRPASMPGTPITYGELDRQANRIAHRLLRLGVRPEMRVGLFLERGADMVAGLLGILKAGGAVAVLDPEHPGKRLAFLLNDTDAQVVLTRGSLLAALPETSARVVDFDRGFEAEPSGRPDSGVEPHHLAYVLYTSGSTGEPNGVLIEHRGLVSSIETHIRILETGPSTRLLHLLSFNFDAAMAHLFDTLCAGGALYLAPRDSDFLGAALVARMEREAITHLPIVPTMLATMPVAELPSLHTVLSGGEKCSAELVSRWGGKRRFLNVYGPTETSILATFAHCVPDGKPPPIGRPIANMQAYVVDRWGQLAPLGAVGELWLGGVGLARGYLNRPELTARKFIENPFMEGQGRLYRSGDMVRYRAVDDGPPLLEFVGRTDHQVKIRGHRVETAEVESALRASPLVRDAAVVVHQGAGGEEARLVGYVAPASRTRNRQWELDQVASWTALSSEIDNAAEPDLSLDVRGWKSSYSGEDLPLADMRAWAESTVARILDLAPREVLEIGCGTGMLLARIAPGVQRYRGTDLARHAIDHVAALKAGLPGLDNVVVSQQPAHDLSGLGEGPFDTVILNSVVQYFPSADYLLEIIEGVLERMSPTGAIFLGDIRNLALLETYHASVEHFRAGGALGRRELRERVQRALVRENELVLQPEFFTALRARFPRIVEVEIAPKRGHYRNELSLFRYDVTLRIGAEPAAQTEIEWRDAGSEGLTLDGLRSLIARSGPGRTLGLRKLPNARIHKENKLAAWLAGETGDGRRPPVGVDEAPAPAGWWAPETLYSLATELPCRVHLSWAAGHPDGSFDAVVTTGNPPPRPRLPLEAAVLPARWSDLANDPLQATVHRKLSVELRAELQEALPSHLVPQTIVVLPSLPLTLNGKVDLRALPAPETVLEALDGREEPRNPMEQELAALWTSVLGVTRIGIHDNFFELGGHSLMAVRMMSRVETELGKKLPLSLLFQAPTIALLAQHIAGNEAQAAGKSSLLTPLQPHGDRPPVLFFAPFSFHAVYFHELGRRLGPDQPFYLIHPADITATFPDETDVDRLAARIADAIAARWPRGPHVLSGHSAGALMALPVAIALEARGHATTLVSLDMSAPRSGRRPVERPEGAPVTDRELERRVLDHVPRTPYTGRPLVLAAAEAGEDGRRSSMAGWQRFCAQPVHNFTVPGNHMTMVQEPNVGAIVEHLRGEARGTTAPTGGHDGSITRPFGLNERRSPMSSQQNVDKSEPRSAPEPFPVVWDNPEEAQAMWLFDVIHCPAPVARLDFDLRMHTLCTGGNRVYDSFGLPAQLKPKLIHGFIFQRFVPGDVAPEAVPGMLKEADGMVRQTYRELASLWEKTWLPEIQAHLAGFASFDPGGADWTTLLAQLMNFKVRTVRLWELHNTILLPTLVALSDFEEAYRDLFPEAQLLESYDLLAGFPNKTTEANLRLWELGRSVGSTLRPLLTESAPETVPTALAETPEGRALWSKIEDYLRTYGERNDDLFLTTPTWIDDPTAVVRGLREAVLRPERDLAEELQRQASTRETRLSDLRALLASHPQAVRDEFERLLAAAQMATVLTEDHHFWIDCKVTHHARRLCLEVGRRLVDGGVLESPHDVFHLSLEEITGLGAIPAAGASRLRASITERKAEAARYAGVTPPPLLGVPSPMMNLDCAILRATAKFNGNLYGPPGEGSDLTGMAGSRGKISGPARVVRTIEEASTLKPGDILVAPFTLPSWTPFFASVAAVVTNVGGILCHAAVVAREYGIPAVVGTQRATEVIRDGQIIEVDGDAGIVRVTIS